MKTVRIQNVFLLIILLAATGCVERKLTINTNPSGAQVFLNDEEIGVSPVTASFNWYGDYNITIRPPRLAGCESGEAGKQGCETLQTHRKLQAPWYDLFPFDFLTQILYPGRIVDSREWSFDLAPQKEISRQELIKAAEQLKQKTED